MNNGLRLTGYTIQDEDDLLWFSASDASERAMSQEFKALYMPMPGYPPPTPETGAGFPIEIVYFFFPKGIHKPADTVTWKRKIPLGVINKFMYDARDNEEKKKQINNTLMSAIMNKHHHDMLDYAQARGWTCVHCNKPCLHVSCKYLLPNWQKIVFNPCQPECDNETCSLKLKADAEIILSEVQKMVRNNVGGAVGTLHPEAKKQMLEECTRMCRICCKTDTSTFKVQACSKCKITFYCGRECQLKDWKRHKIACKAVTTTSASSSSSEKK